MRAYCLLWFKIFPNKFYTFMGLGLYNNQPKILSFWDFTSGRIICCFEASKNEWLRCFGSQMIFKWDGHGLRKNSVWCFSLKIVTRLILVWKIWKLTCDLTPARSPIPVSFLDVQNLLVMLRTEQNTRTEHIQMR